MGTHPIFESDFDCLTELLSEAMEELNAKQKERSAIERVRRNLFDTTPNPETLRNLKNENRSAAAEKTAEFNFDFRSGQPSAESPSDNYVWQKVPENSVPEFYKSA